MSIHEECGVFGIFGSQKADMAGLCYYGLFSVIKFYLLKNIIYNQRDVFGYQMHPFLFYEVAFINIHFTINNIY